MITVAMDKVISMQMSICFSQFPYEYHCLLSDYCLFGLIAAAELLYVLHPLYRMETEIEALETQELQISANEEVILKRLKEVERTAEDIIKVLLV